MNGLFTWLLIGLAVYFLFFRRGGMGCCGGHENHDHGSGNHSNPEVRRQNPDQIIDLDKNQYKVITEDAKHPGMTA
jgi:hypothetical protein